MKRIFNRSFLLVAILIFGIGCKDSGSNQNGETGEVNVYYEEETAAFEAYQHSDYQKCIKITSDLIRKDSFNASNYYLRASAKWAEGDGKGAKSDYLSSSNLDYRVSDCYYSMGILEMFLNDAQAQRYLEKAIENYKGPGKGVELSLIKKKLAEVKERLNRKDLNPKN